MAQCLQSQTPGAWRSPRSGLILGLSVSVRTARHASGKSAPERFIQFIDALGVADAKI